MANVENLVKKRFTESYWPATKDTSVSVDGLTIVGELRACAAECPDRIALVDGVADPAKRRRWTYTQLLKDVERVASALLKRFKPGERVAIWLTNGPEYELLVLGCAMAGLTFVPVILQFREKELGYALRQSDSVGLFLVDEFRGVNLLKIAKEVCKNLPQIREVIRLSEFETFMISGNQLENFPEIKPKDPFLLMYTSGTTGSPKGALLHNMGYLGTLKLAAERQEMKSGDININMMPLFHVAGLSLLLFPLLHRGTHVLSYQFDPPYIMGMIESEKPVYSLMVPTILDMLLNNPDRNKYNLSSLKTFILGGGRIDPALVNRAKDELGWTAMIIFGMTESSAAITSARLSDTATDKATTVGKPLPLIGAKIIDPTTKKVVPVGVAGELCARSEFNMNCYYNKPEETAAALDAEGWLHTGDLATMDERGYIKIVGRLKELINRGSEKFSPNEIEAVLKEHPKVGDVSVIGIPDQRWGEQVGAVIIPRPTENPPKPAELAEYCKDKLASFKRPRLWYFVTEFPMTGGGKIQKFAMRERVIKGELKAEPE